MQIPWDFKLCPSQYSRQGREFIIFPLFDICPICHAAVRLHRHGFYSRNVLTADDEYRIEICRYLCLSCRATISLLPIFLLPRFQRCSITILEALKGFFARGIYSLYRQITIFYVRRFQVNMNAVIMDFRERGLTFKIPEDDKERAIKLIDLLSETLASHPDNSEPTVHRNFMALSL